MARVEIPVFVIGANDAAELDLIDEAVAFDATNDHYFLNPTGRVALLAILDEETDVTIKVIGVDDPYGRGASPAGDITYTPSTATGEFKTFVLGRYTAVMFNQVATRQTNVDVSGLTGTGYLIALAI